MKEASFRYTGNLSSPRGVLSLVNQRIISINELGWYLAFVMQADFGHKYKSYGVINVTDSSIAKELNCDPTTVCKKRNKLAEKGLLITSPRKNSKIVNYQLFSGNKNISSEVVKVTNFLINSGDVEMMSKIFLSEEAYMKKCQEANEKQRNVYIQKM